MERHRRRADARPACPPRSTTSSAGSPTWRSPATGGRPWPASTSTPPPTGNRKSHCSAFIATGSATTDGRIVIGHETFTEFWNGQFMNVILDIIPDDGHRMVMQTSPGWIASMTDFWMTGGGLVVVERRWSATRGSTRTRFPSTSAPATPASTATSIDEWVELMDAENNGGYANMWLIGDIKTGEIADYEQGLIYQNLREEDRRLVLRRQRPERPAYPQRREHRHRLQRRPPADRRAPRPLAATARPTSKAASTPRSGRSMLGDTFDPYLGYINPSSRTICSHYDEDPMELRQRSERGLEHPLLPGRFGRRQGDDRGAWPRR